MNAEITEEIFTEDARMAAINSHLEELEKITSDVENLGSSDEINAIVDGLANIRWSLHFLI